jgi:hypothetical protein
VVVKVKTVVGTNADVDATAAEVASGVLELVVTI